MPNRPETIIQKYVDPKRVCFNMRPYKQISENLEISLTH